MTKAKSSDSLATPWGGPQPVRLWPECSTQAWSDREVDAERVAHHLVVDVHRLPDKTSLKLSAVLGRHGVRAAVRRPRAEQDRAIDADVLIFERGAVGEAVWKPSSSAASPARPDGRRGVDRHRTVNPRSSFRRASSPSQPQPIGVSREADEGLRREPFAGRLPRPAAL